MLDSTSRGNARRSSGSVPVLLYHSVSGRPPASIERYSMPFSRFREQMNAVVASEREPCTFAELVAEYKAAGDHQRERVCVTFDDGWADNRAATELLAELGVPATIFVTSGSVGEPDMFSLADLRAVASLPGIEIGAHSVSHPRLDELPREMVVAEVRDGKDSLEQWIGREVTTFAYPFGAHDRRVREAVIDAGFVGAAAVKNAISYWSDDPFAVARWSVELKFDNELVHRVINGEGAQTAWQGERIRTRGYRSFRRARRRVFS